VLSFPRRKAEDVSVRGRWMVQKIEIESTCAPVVVSLQHGVQTICIEVEKVLRYLSKRKRGEADLSAKAKGMNLDFWNRCGCNL